MRKPAWKRLTTYVILGAFLGGQIQAVSAATASIYTAGKQPALPGTNLSLVTTPDWRSERTRPVAVRSLDGDVSESELWGLFDERAGSALQVARPTRWRVRFPSPIHLDTLGVFGGGEGKLVLMEGGETTAPLPLASYSFQGTDWRWQRHALPAMEARAVLDLEWQPAKPGTGLRELEFWGSSALPSTSRQNLPDALYSGIPQGAWEFKAIQAAQSISVATVTEKSAAGQFEIPMQANPKAFARAFLLYDLEGLPHFTAASRSINGQAVQGKFGVAKAGKAGLQVEEIAPYWLKQGTNLVRFAPANESDPVGYQVQNLRIVGIPGSPAAVSESWSKEWHDPWTVKQRKNETRLWQAESYIQPRAMDVHLSRAGSGALLVAAGTKKHRATAELSLDGLSPGWHRLPLETLPVVDRLTLVLSGGQEQSAEITEVKVSTSPMPVEDTPKMAITYPLSGECVDRKIHVRGFVLGDGLADIRVQGKVLPGSANPDGSFAFQVPEPGRRTGKAKEGLTVEAHFANGSWVRQNVAIGKCVERVGKVIGEDGRLRKPVEDVGAPYGGVVSAKKGGRIAFAGMEMEVPPGAVDRDMRVTIRPLATDKIAAMDSGMTNVTPGQQAYRCGPHGMLFKKPVKLVLPYDKGLIPQGYTEADVRTFYYDESLKKWQQVGLLAQGKGALMALSEHFTDFINATIATPEGPGTQSLNPTSMKDIKIANPAAGIDLIAPPTPNSRGTAELHYPIEVPPGRRGIQPNLAITYNSESRNGWLGVGWDLRMSAIQVDTRFGVPKYNGQETYLLDGQMLTPMVDANGQPTKPSGAPSDGVYFARRAEGAFDWIQRLGSTPATFSWVLTDKSGTKTYYGETSASRLADPAVASGNIFRWSLSRVSDPYGNEMKVTYQPDSGTTTDNPEPFAHIYPSLIDYTSNATNGLQATYHIDFIRGDANGASCNRTDVIIDGRPGFQELTRCLLTQVNVRYGTQIIRQYNLSYQPPASANLQKTLLSSIDVRGLDGQTSFYHHDFSYFSTPTDQNPGGLESLGIFQPAVEWATVPMANGNPRVVDGLNHAKDKTSSTSGRVGFGIPGALTLGVGVGDTVSGEVIDWDTHDVNGDGLLDGIASDGLLDLGGLISAEDRSSVDKFSGKFTPLQTDNFNGPGGFPGGFLAGLAPLSKTNRHIVNLRGGVSGIGKVEGNFDWANTARELRTLADMNGDGYLDQVIPTSSGLTVRLNDRQNRFKPAQSWNNYAISHTSCSLNNLLGPILEIGADMIGKFWAPVSGVLKVAGDIGHEIVDTGGNVIVTIWKGFGGLFLVEGPPGSAPPDDLIKVWSAVIRPNDPPCSPGPNNSCAGGLSIPVEAGDRIYTQISAGNSPGKVIAWDPQLTYQSVDSVPLTPSEQNLREPEGSYIYRFSQSADFRPVGRAYLPWSADSDGIVRIDGLVAKNTTSDDVQIRIIQDHWDGITPSVRLTQTLPGSYSGSVPTTLGGIAVQAGDQLSFQVLSDLPIDPQRVAWQPVVTYENYCRLNPTTGTKVCGDVNCSTNPTVCAMAEDPQPNFPIPSGILKQKAVVFYPLFRFQPGTATKTFVIPADGPVTIAGSVSKSSVTQNRVVVAIQGVNNLFLKRTFEPNDIGTVPMSLTTSPLKAGDQLFFTVYSDTDIGGAISWAPKVQETDCPLNIKVRASGMAPDPSGVGVMDVMGGGYHGWSYGDWNGSKPLTESQIAFDPQASVHDFFPLLIVPPSDLMEQGASALSFDPIGAVGAITHFSGRVVGGVKDSPNGNVKTFGSAVGLGHHLLGPFTGWLSSLFCETEHPVRVSSIKNIGLEFGIGPANAGFNTGSSATTVEIMDMNGDGYTDSVTGEGVRFNTGAQFESSIGTAELPYGDPRRSEFRNVHLGASAGNLVTLSDSSGNPVGFFGIGAGLSYGVSATERDLIDINGDGLPDHVRSDATSGNVFVRLNFGYRFSTEIKWSASPWSPSVHTVSPQQDLVNYFGDDLRTDSLRVTDISMNAGGLGGMASGCSIGGIGSKTDTLIRQLVDTLDVNGDGLPDQVLRSPGLTCSGGQSGGCLRVKLNLGGNFDVEKEIPVGNWPADAPSGMPGGLANFGLGTPDALSFTVGEGSSGNVSCSVPVVPFEVGGSYAWASSDNWTSQSFKDIDGDGTLDQVLKANGSAKMYARLNTTGKTNLLKHVSRPLGGGIYLDYGREGNQVDASVLIDNPKNHWALAKVSVEDGRTNRYTTVFDYSVYGPGITPRLSSGHYDRDEREDYGYSHVTSTRGIKQNGVFKEGDGSRLDQFFLNQNYYQQGALSAEYERDPDGKLLRGRLIGYATPPATLAVRTGTFFPKETSRYSLLYEGSTGFMNVLPLKWRLEERDFDEDGNLKLLVDHGDEQSTGDDVRYDIGYFVESATHITRANSIVATDSQGTILRSRSATYFPAVGSLQTLTNYVYGGKDPATQAAYNGTASTHTYDYDTYGNLRTHTDPRGYKLQYKYDTVAQTYPTEVDDMIFGYASFATPNYLFGASDDTTDINGQKVSYKYDSFGRLTEVRGPTDQGSTPTIAMTYTPSATPAYAITKHKDVQHLDDTINTVTFIDGLERVIQTKKDLELDTTGEGSPQVGMSVSGLITFDNRGRVATQGQPVFNQGSETSFVSTPSLHPTTFAYDSLGRTIKVIGPDGATTTTQYFISTDDVSVPGKWLATRVIDPMGNATGAPELTGQKVTYSDAAGRQVAVKEHNQIGASTSLTALITRYQYNPMGELVKVIDAKLKETTSVYDTLGQMVVLTSPDAGKTEYLYDLNGNLGAKQTAVLAGQSKLIKYTYENNSNRLKTITYPTMSAVTYVYGTNAEKGGTNNLAGRVKQVTMEGGSELRYYDKMGNVNKTITSLKHLKQPSIANQQFTMKFSYDPFGRMQTMTYPNWIQNDWKNVSGEGELVTYAYDRGGNIDKITGYQQTQNPQHPEFTRNFTYLSHIGYDEFGQRRIMTSGNGIVNKYDYDPVTRRLQKIDGESLGAQERQLKKAPTPFHAMRYYYDLVGNITKVENATTVYTWQNASVRTGPMRMQYTYDNLYQLKSATGEYRPDRGYGYDYASTFQYDEIANLTKKSQLERRLVWDNQNPPSGLAALEGERIDHTVSSYSYTLDYTYAGTRPHAASKIKETSSSGSANDRVVNYDANGNNTGNVYKGATRTQTWDEENRLKEVKDATVSRGKFLYSPDGERTQKQTAAGDAFYVNQFFVLQPSGILPTKHIFAGETRIATKTDPISQVPMISYYHPDHLGSTSYTSGSDQTLLQHERYFPFGERDTGDQEECDLGRPDNMRRSWIFTSKELDFDTGLYYFGARYYDPKTSVWQSPDPILNQYMRGAPNEGVFQSRNLNSYTYSWNNPVGMKDPDGQVVWFVVGAAAAIAILKSSGTPATPAGGGEMGSRPTSTGEFVNNVLQAGTFLFLGGFGKGRSGPHPAEVPAGPRVGEGTVLAHAPKAGPVGEGTVLAPKAEGPALPESYWMSRQAPTQVEPGVHNVSEMKPSSRSAGEVYRRTTHYDQYGRSIGQTHHTSHGEPSVHPDPHHHVRNPTTGQTSGPQLGPYPTRKQ